MKRLRLPTNANNALVKGIATNDTTTSSKSALIRLNSDISEFQLEVEALVMPRLTGIIPTQPLGIVNKLELSNLRLADKLFDQPGRIEMLLGADIYPHIIKEGVLKFNNNSFLAQNTIFGWVISGSNKTNKGSSTARISSFHSEVSLEAQLKAFWESEEVPCTKFPSESERLCEIQYKNCTKRGSDGKYTVKLPFLPSYPHEISLSNSRNIALNRYRRTELRLKRDQSFKQIYDGVVQEYLDMNHMVATTADELHSITPDGKQFMSSCYLPHHGVVKPGSTTTKLRVVFDASCKTQNAHSLNDVLQVGPVLQRDLTSLLIQWRKYPYVFNADIEKMYRQIWVHDDHTNYQRILYTDLLTAEISDYKLLTVTFGLSCAPYLAIRTLLQLAQDGEDTFPIASKIVRDEMYVDDVLSGEFSIEAAILAEKQLHSLLMSGGVPLRKWSTNHPALMQHIPPEHQAINASITLQEESVLKTLGIHWNNHKDCFTFRIKIHEKLKNLIKREIFSQIAKLFDPAGWLAPVIVNSKNFVTGRMEG